MSEIKKVEGIVIPVKGTDEVEIVCSICYAPLARCKESKKEWAAVKFSEHAATAHPDI